MTATTAGLCAADLQAQIEDLTDRIIEESRMVGVTNDRARGEIGDRIELMEEERDELALQGRFLLCPGCNGIGSMPGVRTDGTACSSPCPVCHPDGRLRADADETDGILVPEWVWDRAVEAKRQHAARERREDRRHDRRAKTGAGDVASGL